ncbi:PGF-pre-PGF domain-containing protein [Methanohalobium evestigatum]|uniref:PGF-pre-PGF domain-containing protein n=1 Tax=Methanohalobium evestigatum TaxID=2322 RepID=UPI000A015914
MCYYEVIVDTDSDELISQTITISIKNAKGHLKENDIEDAVITFKIEKSWIKDNNVNISTISLYKNNGDNCKDLSQISQKTPCEAGR